MRGTLLNWLPPLTVPTDSYYSTVFATGQYVTEMPWAEFVFWEWRVAALTVDWSITAEWPGFVGFPGPYSQSGTFTMYKAFNYTVDPPNPLGVYQDDIHFETEREYAEFLGQYYHQLSMGVETSKLWQGWEGRHFTTDGASVGDASAIWIKYNRDLSSPTRTVTSALALSVLIATPGGWGAAFTNATDEDQIPTTATASLEGVDLRSGETYLLEPEMHGVAPDPAVIISGHINVTATAFYEWRNSEGPLYNISTGAPE